MSASFVLASWQKILELSQEMSALAVQEEWTLLLEKENERRVAIGAFFAQPFVVADAPAVASGIQELMAMDRAMCGVFAEARQGTLKKIGAMRLGRRMDSAYAAHG